jgi:diaminopimelate decarboxylase
MDHFNLRGGVLHCEEVPLPAIAEAVGTPVYVYSTATMLRHAQVLRAALAGLDDPLIAYAVKANPNTAVLATLAKEMRLALQSGLYQFNLESVPEAELLSEVACAMGMRAPVAYRINPDVVAGTHAKISTGASDSKFGVPIGDAMDAYRRSAALPGLAVQGIAVHIGSQLTSLAPLESAAAKLGSLIAELRSGGHDMRTADLGGGLGVPYDAAQAPPPSPEDYGAMVKRVASGWGVRLIFEPGRLIVGNAGVLLTRIVRVKPGAVHPFVVADAAMNDLMRPALYEAWHSIDAVSPRAGEMRATVVGPVCETGDTFATGRTLTPVEAGDLLVFRTAGAYGAAMSSTYNSRPLTPEVLVDGDRWAVVRERQRIEALIEADRIPDWLSGCNAPGSG